MNIKKNFLSSEINYQESYNAIMEFIESDYIKSGEYEGNIHIIKKIDQRNFFIFPEFEYPDCHREIHAAISISRDELIKVINDEAIIHKIVISHYSEAYKVKEAQENIQIKKGILEDFLHCEICSESYNGIIEFIDSFDIRSGEYKFNRYIIKKMDRINFFIFSESEYEDGSKKINETIAIYHDILINKINEYAISKGIMTR